MSILEEYVSQVIRRSLSNITGNLKKAVHFGDYFLKILDFFVSCRTSLSQNSVRKIQTGIFSVNGYGKDTNQ